MRNLRTHHEHLLCLLFWLILIQGPKRSGGTTSTPHCQVGERHCRLVHEGLTEIPTLPDGDVVNGVSYLQLSNNNITRVLRRSLASYPSLEKLFLDSNSISFIEGGAFSGMSSLLTLHLHNNKFANIRDDAFCGAVNLVELDISDNRLFHVRGFLNCLHNLEQLHLRNNVISFIHPSSFVNSSRLKGLDLSSNDLDDKSLKDDIFGGLSSLHNLDLSDNRLTTIDGRLFAAPTVLRKVFLSGNNLVSVDMTLWPRDHLHAVHFTGVMNVSGAPPNVRIFGSSSTQCHNTAEQRRTTTMSRGGDSLSCGSHKHCRFVDRGLTEIPPTSSESVEYLHLSNNSITRISTSSLGGYSHLRGAFLDSNDIGIINDGAFAGMSKLTTLFLNKNSLKMLNNSTFRGATHLVELDLSDNKIYFIHGSFAGLVHLEFLHLRCNKIKFISPNTFTNSSNLRVLDFGSNQLDAKSSFSFSIPLPVHEIDLSNNYFDSVPVDLLQNFRNLSNLVLSGNNLTSVDMALWPNRTLRSIYLRGNHHLTRITNVPDSVQILSAGVIPCSLENLPALYLITGNKNPCPGLLNPVSSTDDWRTTQTPAGESGKSTTEATGIDSFTGAIRGSSSVTQVLLCLDIFALSIVIFRLLY